MTLEVPQHPIITGSDGRNTRGLPTNVVTPSAYAALPEVTFIECEALDGSKRDASGQWSSYGHQTAVDDAVDQTHAGTYSIKTIFQTGIRSTFLYENGKGTRVQYVFDSSQNIAPYRFLSVWMRWNTSAGGAWENNRWEFRLSSGTDISTMANVHTRFRVSRVLEDTWTEIIIPVVDNTAIRSFGLYSRQGNSVATSLQMEVWLDDITKMATPKWLRASEAATSTLVMIPPGWTEATSDPAYMMPVSGKLFWDMRGNVQVHSKSGGKNAIGSFLLDDSGATDTAQAWQLLLDNVPDNSEVECNSDSLFLFTADLTPMLQEKRNIHFKFKGARFHTLTYPHNVRMFEIGKETDRITWDDFNVFGYSPNAETLATDWGDAIDVGATNGAGFNTIVTRGNALHSKYGRFGRMVDWKAKWDVTIYDSAQVAADCEVSLVTEPFRLTDGGSAVTTATQDGGSSSTTFTDSSLTSLRDDLVQVGMWIRNKTDGCEGAITAVGTTTLTVSGLNGGTGNTFENGDVCEVFEKVIPDVYIGSTQVIGADNVGNQVLTLAATPGNTYTLRGWFKNFRNYFTGVQVRKMTATANTITVTACTSNNFVTTDNSNEFNGGLYVTGGDNIQINRLHGESLGGDAIDVIAATHNRVTATGWESYFNRRQGASVAGGKLVLKDGTVIGCARSSVDWEPNTGSYDIDCEIDGLEIHNGDATGGTTALGIASAIDARVTRAIITNVRRHRSSPSANGGQNMISGGSKGGRISDLYDYDGGLVQIEATDMVLSNITAGKLYLNSTTARCVVDGFHSLTASNYDSIVRDSGTHNRIKNVTSSFDGATTATPGSTGVGPVDILTSVPTEGVLLDIDPGAARQRFPNTYPAVDLGNRIPYGGWNLYLEKIYNIGALSGRSTRPPVYGGRNFNNDPASPVTVGVGVTAVDVAFPVRTSPGTIVNAGGWPVGVNRGTGALAASTTYYYRIAARLRDSGPFAATAQISVTTGGGHNAVQFALEGFQETDDLLTGYTIYRSLTNGGPYEFRYDVIPSSTYPLGTNVKRNSVAPVDLGTTLSTGAAAAGEAMGSRGWPTSVTIVDGVDFGAVTLTANTYDGAGSTTVFEDANADFINDGVRVGYKVTESGGGATATITAVTKTTITHGALSGAGAWLLGETLIVTRQWTGSIDESGYEADRNYAIALSNFRIGPSTSAVAGTVGTWDWSKYDIDRWVGGFRIRFTNAPVDCDAYCDWDMKR